MTFLNYKISSSWNLLTLIKFEFRVICKLTKGFFRTFKSKVFSKLCFFHFLRLEFKFSILFDFSYSLNQKDFFWCIWWLLNENSDLFFATFYNLKSKWHKKIFWMQKIYFQIKLIFEWRILNQNRVIFMILNWNWIFSDL